MITCKFCNNKSKKYSICDDCIIPFEAGYRRAKEISK